MGTELPVQPGIEARKVISEPGYIDDIYLKELTNLVIVDDVAKYINHVIPSLS